MIRPDEWARGEWDDWFEDWIDEAARSGRDPNDIGDERWHVDSEAVAREHYLPLVRPDDVVLELGPGTGRITRFVLPRCRRMILADYSRVVCRWLPLHFRGEGSFDVVHLSAPTFPSIPPNSVDLVISHGVFEHLDFDDASWFLEDFARVLRPDGKLRFNYENLLSAGGAAFLGKHRIRPGHQNVFRFYTPEMMERMVRLAGFTQVRSLTSDDRWAFLDAVA
ncbi:MAG: class I SAM-dependent methyltransferase [Gemmatimonadetes bacterium]|nr:class I SAM-dependent methyltransferase [Gemmatimonadota bacterium]NNK64704.1 class I SAM-dependent methyltransferase [Gemmatimonadota bacterium]